LTIIPSAEDAIVPFQDAEAKAKPNHQNELIEQFGFQCNDLV